MRPTLLLAIAILLTPFSVASAQESEFLSTDKRGQDFEALCGFVSEHYAYFDIKATDWGRTCKHYLVEAQVATDMATYVRVLERTLGQLYDPHAHLAINTRSSPRLVPSQADVMATWLDDKALVTDLRQGSAAERSGLRVGDEIEAINNMPVAKAAAEFEPAFLFFRDKAARDWALQVALAGRHDGAQISLEIKSSSGLRKVAYAPSFVKQEELLAATKTGLIGYIRIHNSLGDQSLVREFDSALDSVSDAQALIIDLRDTPSGGNSGVARGILGRLVDKELPYQRHELVGEFRNTGIRRVWTENVAPRGTVFRGPVVVLVGRWTGSMGEGLAIGLNATREAPVLGRPMAQLLGALGEFTLSHSKIVVRIPVEKLFHVDGRPRESFMPCTAEGRASLSVDEDRWLTTAFDLARSLVQRKSNSSLEPTAFGGC